MLTSQKLAAALMAAAAVLNDGAIETAAPAAVHVDTDGDKVADFLRNDQSGFQRRSASAIAKATGLSEGAVIAAAQSHSDLEGKPSQGNLGYLVWLAS